jgi:succinate dehydrogenase / fumarate reductase, flavoprotein subunit
MIREATVKRDNQGLKRAMEKIKELRERYRHISLDDRTRFANQTYAFAHRFCSMLELALVVVKGALQRDESRGAHYKPEFPNRNDENWLKTTIAEYDAAAGEPRLSYRSVDTRHLSPTTRDYTQAQKMAPAFQNIPANIKLPI